MPFQRYRILLVDAVNLLLDTLAHQGDYGGFLLDGQTVVAEDYLEVCPERRDELQGYVQSGRVTLGPWYVLPDEFIPSAESLVRNLLLGRRQMRALGAPPARVGYLPDTFGHPAQLPQILAGFDLDSMVIFRGVQIDTSEFLWEAPDGTRLLTIYLPGGYYNGMELARAPQYWLDERLPAMIEQLTRFATTPAVLVMNGCDHFNPQPATQAILDEANRRQDEVHLRQGTLAEYVDLVRPALPRLTVRRGEWRHNRPARITPGVLSARMYLKQADFQAATTLERGAEPLQALAWALGGPHDTGLLDTAWRYLLQNHPHDSICGCSIDAVHEDGEARYRWAQQIGDDLTHRAAVTLAARIAAPGPGFAVFNTLAAPRTELIHQRLHFLEPDAAFTLVDAAGAPVPYQEVARRPMKLEWDPQRTHFYASGRVYPTMVVSPPPPNPPAARWQRWLGEEVEILFRAPLPAGGYTTVQVLPDEGTGIRDQGSGAGGQGPVVADETDPQSAIRNPGYPLGAAIRSGPNWLENDQVRVEVAADGAFYLDEKTTGRRFGPLNVFRSEADRGDEYSFCPAEEDQPVSSRDGRAQIALVEDGPLRATLEIRLALEVPAELAVDRRRRVAQTVTLPICTRLSLSPGRRRVEIRTELDNTARDHRLRALFATGVQTEVADAQGQFEVVRRPVALPAEERARVPEFDEEQEVSYHPQRAVVDVSDAGGGLAVLNRGLPEYEAEPGADGVTLALTLLRCVGWLSRDDLSTRYKHAGPPLETPAAQCPGPHTFEYAVVPHPGDWLEGAVAQEAEEYVTPVHSAALPFYPNADAALPAAASFYRLQPSTLLFSACKRREDGQGWLLRATNIAPDTLTARLDLARPATVRRANLAERELSDPLPATPTPDGTHRYTVPVRPHEIVTLSITEQDSA
jgi:alpha-mannosidase